MRLQQPRHLLLALAMVSALGGMLFAHGSQPASGTQQQASKVAAAVEEAVARGEKAAVLVTLREPPAAQAASLDIADVKTQVAATQADVLTSLDDGDFAVRYRYEAVPALAGTVDKEGLERLSSHPDVAEVTLDGVGWVAMNQSGPLIHAPEVHDTGLTGAGVVVAVLDTGIKWNHADLQDSIAYEECFSSDCGPAEHPAEDGHGHGTNVSGIITSNGIAAPRGIAPDAEIAAYKVLGDNGFGSFSDWTAALDDILANHPEVRAVNMSLQSTSTCPAGAMDTAVSMLRKQDVLTFIAAGNRGIKNSFTIPVCIPDSVAVGASYDDDVGAISSWKGVACLDSTTVADQVTCWSGSDESLDLIAPGSRITSTGATFATSTFSGTSQATPHAAAVAALLWEAYPELSAEEVQSRMESTGTLVTDDMADEDPKTNRTTPRIDARVALLDLKGDFDGDGCGNDGEWGSDPSTGGLRNPLNPHDFYDVNGDGAVNLVDDIMAVANAVGPAVGANYHPSLDRSPAPPGAEPWDLGPPDGVITISDDVIGVIMQFGHRCN